MGEMFGCLDRRKRAGHEWWVRGLVVWIGGKGQGMGGEGGGGERRTENGLIEQ